MATVQVNRRVTNVWTQWSQAHFAGRLGDLILAFVLWRLLIYLAAYVATTLVALNPTFQFPHPFTSASEFLFGTWVHWDAAWYLNVIQNGYSYFGPAEQANIAFFPLYPLLVGFLSRLVTFGAYDHYTVIATGVLLSNLCALAAMLVLFRLTHFELERKQVAGAEQLAFRASLFFIFFPTSVFFASFYAEALFALLLITSFSLMRRGNFLLGGLVGAAASMCRLNGIVLLVPYAVEYFQRWRLRPRREALAFFLIPLGFLLYCAFLYYRFGEPLAFMKVYSAPGWHGSTGPFPFYQSLGNIVSFPSEPSNVWRFLEISYTLGALLLAFLSLRYLPLPYAAFAIIFCLIPLAADTWSMQRYVLSAFPIFMTLGAMSRSERLFSPLIGLFIFMLAISTVMWVNGLWLG